MRLPWILGILIVMGLVAAVSAALLVAFLKLEPMNKAKELVNNPIDVLVASRDLAPQTVVQDTDVEVRKVLPAKAPRGSISDPVQAVGNVLLTSVNKGQVFTNRLFAPDGSGKYVASKLPGDKRAFTIQLANDSAMVGLIYPGCTVDVIAGFTLPSNSDLGTALSTTLVENVEVLAVGNRAVGEEAGEKKEGGVASQSRGILVTVLVDPEQAKALQLARQHGDISLVLRNPVEGQPDKSDVLLLKKGQLAKLGEALASRVKPEEPSEPEVVVSQAPEPEPKPEPEPIHVSVVRGLTKKVVTFPKQGAK